MGEDEACEQALALAKEKLNSKPQADTEAGRRLVQFTSLAMAAEQDPEANLALISVPGDYAAAEAIKAIELGMHVMLFSDNVSLAEKSDQNPLLGRKSVGDGA
jgi:succinyl-CoA synthetase alpha subunit